MCKIPVYYIINYREVIPCYLIKEGYIPCQDYRENPDDDYYAYGDRVAFVIASPSHSEVYDSLKLAVENTKQQIQKRFQEDVEHAVKERDLRLDDLKNLKGKY